VTLKGGREGGLWYSNIQWRHSETTLFDDIAYLFYVYSIEFDRTFRKQKCGKNGSVSYFDSIQKSFHIFKAQTLNDVTLEESLFSSRFAIAVKEMGREKEDLEGKWEYLR